MIIWERLLFLSATAYLIGSLPFASMWSFLFGLPNPFSHGSFSAGATNVFRKNKWAALLTLLTDMGKGWVLTCCLPLLLHPYFMISALGFACLIFFGVFGHIFSVFLVFRGGKGVATTVGVVMGINPVVACLGLAVMAVLVKLTRYSSLSTLSGLLFIEAILIYLKMPLSVILSYTLVLVIVYLKHLPNIQRLLQGTENRL